MRLNLNTLVLLFKDFHDAVYNLVSKIVDMRATFDSTNWVDKTDLLKLAITQTADDFPPIWSGLFNNLWKLLIFLSLKIQINIRIEVLNVNDFPIKLDFNSSRCASSHIVCPLRHQLYDIFIECWHSEPLKIRLKSDGSEVFSIFVVFNHWLFSYAHIVLPPLLVHKLTLRVSSLYNKLSWKYVSELCSKTVPATSHFLFLIIIVRWCQKLA